MSERFEVSAATAIAWSGVGRLGRVRGGVLKCCQIVGYNLMNNLTDTGHIFLVLHSQRGTNRQETVNQVAVMSYATSKDVKC